MGVLRTIPVTRTKAKLTVAEMIPVATDEQLRAMLDIFIEDDYYNCRIVPDDSYNEDHKLDEYP